MYCIEAPERIQTGEEATLFLAGGITGCPNWQAEAKKYFRKELAGQNIGILNPCREKFPMDDPNVAYEQIAWEHRALMRATHILFWFPKETLCPITLFELGRHSFRLHVPIFVGCEPEYARRQDVEVQMQLVRPGFYIHKALFTLFYDVKRKLENFNPRGDFVSS